MSTRPPVGKEQIGAFERSWPDGFHAPIKRSVKTLAIVKKHLKVEDVKVYNTETIYAHTMAMQETSEDLDIKTLLCYEFLPCPAPMWDENGMCEAKARSKLMNALKVDVSSCSVTSDGTFIDGCVLFWVVAWPKRGTVQDFLNNFHVSLRGYLGPNVTIHLVFDRYV